VRAGPARERERSSRQDSRNLSNGNSNKVSGILRGNLCRPFACKASSHNTGFAARRLEGRSLSSLPGAGNIADKARALVNEP